MTLLDRVAKALLNYDARLPTAWDEQAGENVRDLYREKASVALAAACPDMFPPVRPTP